MFLRLVLLCLCLWRLDGVFGIRGEVKYVNVMGGNSVTLNSDLTEMKDDDLILWRFENTLIAEINKQDERITVYDDVLDGRFRHRLKLDNQTGSLTITNIIMKHAGRYRLYMNYKSVDFLLAVKISVKEGDSITLNSDLTEMKDDDVIQWRFENTLIAEINKQDDRFTVYDDVLDGRFRDRLKLDNQTGSLTITDITMKHAGDYKLQINYMRAESFFLTVIDKVESVSVTDGYSVTLNIDLTEIQTDDLILWTFGPNKSLIAKLNRKSSKISIYDDVLDGRFRDRLKLDHQTGSLTITNTRTTDSGLYEGTIEGKKEIRYRFSVSVSGI
ncbi:uncharacterized protein [Chanodichthys erythropterus]|uniref:uncharacterized protein n=1 Tax=Chanodichthys erythropterus TaxID=933992 RepID=UPI00351E7A18